MLSASTRAALLRWYDEHARDLPWRRTRDPYAIWVSEIMLQQTRVDTVCRYYGRFLERFPDPARLAAASEDAVLAAWSGLGYYRRARLLHKGVREVMARYGGRVPEAADARRGLPGIGRYTAGAIGSIAFDLPEPLVDGNVARVLARACGIDTPLGRADTERALWNVAEQLVQGPRPGALNQALMELGASLCAPQAARCGDCPLQPACVAYRDGRTAELPVARPRKAPRPTRWVAVIARARSRLWLAKGQGALFGGLWNLPMAEGEGRAAARSALRAAGLRGRLAVQPAGEVLHVLTHRRLQVQLWRATGVARRAMPGTAEPERLSTRAVRHAELKRLGISALTLKCLELGSRA